MGKSEIFIDGLPGIPDNLKKNGKGSFYVPLIQKRNSPIEYIGEYPTIRMMFVKSIRLLEYTFKMIDSFFPNVYCKKAAYEVNTLCIRIFINLKY